MMMPFPFFGAPNFKRPQYSQTPYCPKDSFDGYCKNCKNGHEVYNTYLNKKTKEEQDNNSCSSDNLFNIFGISLEADDLILLGILFLLYKEDNHDSFLFIVLILLLLGN